MIIKRKLFTNFKVKSAVEAVGNSIVRLRGDLSRAFRIRGTSLGQAYVDRAVEESGRRGARKLSWRIANIFPGQGQASSLSKKSSRAMKRLGEKTAIDGPMAIPAEYVEDLISNPARTLVKTTAPVPGFPTFTVGFPAVGAVESIPAYNKYIKTTGPELAGKWRKGKLRRIIVNTGNAAIQSFPA